MASQSYDSSIQSDIVADLAFTFELNDFTEILPSPLQDEDVTTFVYGGNTYTLSSSLVDNKPSYITDGGMIAWNSADSRWNILTFSGFGGTQINVLHNDDTAYPWRLLNGDLRPEFSNLGDG